MIIQFAFPVAAGLNPHINRFDTSPQRIDAPQFVEIPGNVTLEYGSRFSMTLNLTGYSAAWAINDEENFAIGWTWGCTSAYIHDTHILSVGVYLVRVYVWDEQYAGTSIDIWITVVDSFFPSIEGPGNIEFVEGTNRSRTFTWYAFDANPLSYTITLNSMLAEQGDWTEESCEFSVAIGHLRKGSYAYKLSLQDIGGNIATNSVLVHVLPGGNETSIRTSVDYLINRNSEKYVYIDPPSILFIELFSIIVLSGLVGLVMMAAVAGKAHEFGFT